MLSENTTWKNGNLTEVRCRGCGTLIRALVPDDAFREVKVINGQRVVHERLVLACLPQYREVLLECGGGPGDNFVKSGHVACMCAGCAAEATLGALQEHHDHDMRDLSQPLGRAVNRAVAVAPLIGVVPL